jgi:acetyl esterase/lipase
VVVNEQDVMFVNVKYWLTPEYPFPTAVDDGVEIMYYLALHAPFLMIYVNKGYFFIFITLIKGLT